MFGQTVDPYAALGAALVRAGAIDAEHPDRAAAARRAARDLDLCPDLVRWADDAQRAQWAACIATRVNKWECDRHVQRAA